MQQSISLESYLKTDHRKNKLSVELFSISSKLQYRFEARNQETSNA